MTYESYCKDMKRFKATPMSEKDFNAMLGIEDEATSPLFIEPKSAKSKKVEPTLKAHVEIKPPKEKRAYKYAQNEEERRLARTQYTRTKREKFKEAGLTNKGKPFKNKKAST